MLSLIICTYKKLSLKNYSILFHSITVYYNESIWNKRYKTIYFCKIIYISKLSRNHLHMISIYQNINNRKTVDMT